MLLRRETKIITMLLQSEDVGYIFRSEAEFHVNGSHSIAALNSRTGIMPLVTNEINTSLNEKLKIMRTLLEETMRLLTTNAV